MFPRMLKRGIIASGGLAMAKFTVRFREIYTCEKLIEAESYIEAREIFTRKLYRLELDHEKRTIGLRYEIESITTGEQNAPKTRSCHT